MSHPLASSHPQPAARTTADGAEPARPHVVLGVDLTAAGARPGSHHLHGAVAPRPFDAERFVHLVRTADQGLLDLVTLDEGFLLHPGRRRVPGRLDAAVAAARVAPLTSGVGLVAAVEAVHVDPGHVAAAIARVDRTSGGRAGWQVGRPADGASPDQQWASRAASSVAQVARLWDAGASETAEVGVDGRVRVDHDGIRFAVRRPQASGAPLPQGRPPVVVRAHEEEGAQVAAATADVVRLRVTDAARAARLRALVREAAQAAGRHPDDVKVLVDAYVVLAAEPESARARLELVEAIEGPDAAGGALVVSGTAADLAAVATDWVDAGATDGFVLRPSSLGSDLDTVVGRVVPALQRAGRFRTARPGHGHAGTLRGALGLPSVLSARAAATAGRTARADRADQAPAGRAPAGRDGRGGVRRRDDGGRSPAARPALVAS
ncbi:LLM class flavin-dependent oxidoreductase [Xylanimonas oleitrophica]|uniref:LLM class flavin-dependent oxidoreductase n=1 Tax=Xylanimonas oleitrophica TaxID=2607479 RepID=UPI0015D00CA4|nr:LLM class flavin-dependent oxidoreductase [Xylanimonas oleitrophica]